VQSQKTGKKRWFVLYEDRLCYFNTPTGAMNGEILLSTLQTIFISFPKDYNLKANCFPFNVHCTDREYVIFAESDQERNDWIEAINNQVGKTRIEL